MVSQVDAAAVSREWLTIHEASALIGVSTATLRRWSDAGDIHAFTTPGGHRRFARSAVLGMLPRSRRQRPSLEGLGETRARLARVYRRQIGEAVESAAWVRALGDEERAPLRDHGRRIANGLLEYFDAPSPADRERALVTAERSAAGYGRIAAERGAGMGETVLLFLRFRMPFLRELGGVARRQALDTAEATDLLETATEAIDCLLAALVEGYDEASVCPRTGAGSA